MIKYSENDPPITYPQMNRTSNHDVRKYRKDIFGFSHNNLFKWLSFPKNKKYVRRRFLIFLFGIIDKNSGFYFYLEQLKNFYFQKKTSFYIFFEHLVISDPLLSIWVTDEPEMIIEIFRKTCEEVLNDIFRNKNENFYMSIRLRGFPICDSMRNLKKKKLNSLIKVRGTVITKTQIFPTIGFFKLICLKCLETQEVLFSTVDQKSKKVKSCFNCKSIGPFQTKWEKFIENKFQKISIREKLNSNSFRWLPYSMNIVLTGDLIDNVDYGDQIEITGILKYSIAPKSKQIGKNPFFFILIEANSIQKILNLKHHRKISFIEAINLEKIVNEKKLLSSLLFSFVPDIFRNYFLKLSILLTYCSSSKNKLFFNENARNSINMLIFGNQCSGKSTILKTIFNFFPHSHLLNGYNTSIKGLTNSLRHDRIIEEWVSEGGILTSAKGDLILLDSLEGMSIRDTKSLCKILNHRVINFFHKSTQKEIFFTSSTIATLNIFNSLQSPSLPFFLNNGLEESVISKFDIIFRMENTRNQDYETGFAKFFINKICKTSNDNHRIQTDHFLSINKKNSLTKSLFSQNFTIRYLEYCRNNFAPKYGPIDQTFILKFYLDLKRETRRLNSINFSSNFLETILRIVSSSAKIHLRNFISEKDLAIGLIVFFESWIQLQPYFTGNFLKSKYKTFFNVLFSKFEDFKIFLDKD